MLTLDHFVILISDLNQAVADYEELGFTVTPGGTHADGLTHNALIVFRDGTYLELIAFVDRADTRDNVWGWRQFLLSGGGLIDYCAASPDLAEETERLRRNGLAVGIPSDGGRQRPDGKQLRWRSARFDQGHRVLPFLIEDVTPRALRVPTDRISHPNGVVAVSELTIAVDDLDAAIRQWRVLVLDHDLIVQEDEDDDLDARTVTFQLGAHSIRLAAPRSPASQLYEALPGPFSITVATAQDHHSVWLDMERTYGVRIELIGSP